MVPNINNKIKPKLNDRRGRQCIIPTTKTTGKIANIHRSSLTVHGTQLFNSMPKHIRDTTNVPVEKFKQILDTHFAQIPDQPLIIGYTAHKQAESNSIVHMSKLARSAAAPNSLQVQPSRGGEKDDPQA